MNFFLIPHPHQHGHVLVLATRKCLRPDPLIPCYGPKWFLCLAVCTNCIGSISRNKKKLSTLRFAPSFSDSSFHTTPLKIRFTVTYWLQHYITSIFQIKKRNDLPGQKSYAEQKGVGAAGPHRNATNDKKDDNEAYCLLSFSFF